MQPWVSKAFRTVSAALMMSLPCRCSAARSGTASATSSTTAWRGTAGAEDVVTSDGDLVTGIEHLASPLVSRGVLLDVGRGRWRGAARRVRDHRGPPDGDDRRTWSSPAAGRGDIVLVRTGRLARARREGWKGYAGGPAPGLSFTTASWLHRTEIAAIATDTWGFEVRLNEFAEAFQPLHQVVIPNMGLLIGEMWDLDALAEDCAADGVYEFCSPPLR